MGVITRAMMVPLLTMTNIPNDPNRIVARVMSWVPIYTPFAMMNRAADPPLVDLIGTFILLVASTVTVLWMAGKIFRIGILRTGQPPKIVEMLRWIRGDLVMAWKGLVIPGDLLGDFRKSSAVKPIGQVSRTQFARNGTGQIS